MTIHHHLMRSFVERGRAPTADELAATMQCGRGDVDRELVELAGAHGVVLHPGTTSIWIAHPFSASPAAVWVERHDGAGWWAPCIWCAMGIVTLAAPGATIHTRFGGERDEAVFTVTGGMHVAPDAVVHFAIPPRDAWTNVVHWCSTVLPFRAVADIDPWCTRHGLPRGEAVPIEQVLRLGRAWYGRHLDVEWRKWTTAEAQRIFDSVGLVGDHWRLPSSDERF